MTDTLYDGPVLNRWDGGNRGDKIGYRIKATSAITISGVEIYSFTGPPTKAYLYDDSRTILYAGGDFVGTTAMFSIPYTCTVDTYYYVLVDKEGAAYNESPYDSVSYPVADAGFNWVGSFFDGHTDTSWGRKIYGIYLYTVEGTNMKLNISDVFKDVDSIKINIGDAWKDVNKIQINIGDAWKDVFG